MSSSDDTDSNSSVEVSDDSEIISSDAGSGGDEDMESNDNDDRLSDTNDRNWVSESVFLEGTESAANVMFFMGGSVAALITRPVNTNGTSNRPTIENTHNNDMNSDNIALKPHANNPLTEPDPSFGISTSSGENRATSQKSQISKAVRALEDRVHRDICQDHLSMLWCVQNYGTTPNIVTREPGHIPTKTSILGWFSEPLRCILGGPWIYTPLPSSSHIRVLAIQPGVNDDTLVAFFEILDLNTANFQHEAVSYQWTFRVIGFVGKDYLHASTCFSAIEALTASWFDARKSFSEENSISSTPGRIHRSDEEAMSRIVEIFRSGYWKRLWVVQELVSSRRAIIRWGHAEISWTLLGLATTLIRNDQKLITMFNRMDKSKQSTSALKGNSDARTGLMNAYLMYRMPSAEFRSDSMLFLDVLRLTRNSDVSERLDRIYAVLGLPSQHTGSGSKSIPPDYRLLPNGLYSRVFYWVFQTHKNPLEILSAVQHKTLLYPDYPTWIPQWYVKPIRSIGGCHRAGMKSNASAG
ncbi:hypothetical protein BKA59DRAFT_532602, partial [Fusarium tricinctum]